MKKWNDIKRQESPSPVLDEALRRKAKSPHVVDLSGGRPTLRHPHDYKLGEIVDSLTRGLKKRSNPTAPPRVLYQEQRGPSSRIASRWTEALRMMALGTAVVFTLNIVGVYYQGIHLKEDVATAAYSSYENILQAGISQDAFDQASSQFEDAQSQIWFLQNQRDELLGHTSSTEAVAALLSAGQELSEAGSHFIGFVDHARVITENLFSEKIDATSPSLTEALGKTYDEDFQPAYLNLISANEKVQSIDSNLFPVDLQPTVLEAQTELGDLTDVLSQFNAFFPTVLRLLGDEHPQRYLILLENNNESRPGGGFIGSYTLMDLNDGYLESMTFHDVYEIDGQYNESIDPPGEIAQLTNRWRFRDSNYSPDLAVSSEKGAWFLEEEGGPGVDHVITLDLTLVNQLLTLTGPIKIDSLPIALDAENFSPVLSYMVEAKLSGAQAPKAVLGEFVTAVQDQLKEQKPWEPLLQLIQDMATEKHFSAYSKTESVQDFFEEFGLSATLSTSEAREDYFMVVHTSIGGNKSDAYVSQTLDHETFIAADGTLTNQVTLTRAHEWGDTEELHLRNLLASFGFNDVEGWLVDILGRGANVSGMRFYVPQGSTLISTIGVDQAVVETHTDEDLGLDYFYFPMTVYPQTSETVTLTYTLPFTLRFSPLDEYRLTVFKQPGDVQTVLNKTIASDTALNQYRSFPEELLENAHEEALGTYTWSTPLDRDVHLAQLWGE